MIKNFLLVAIRNIRKNGLFSLINMTGLVTGLTSCLLIALFIHHELTYDDFQQKKDRITRVIMHYSFNGGGETHGGNYTSTKVATTFKRTFPEIESAARFDERERIVAHNNQRFREKNFMFADSSIFDLFSFHLLKGDPATALSGPKKIILTQSTARRYFADADPMGQLLQIGTDSTNYQVTGIMADCPANSQIKFDFLASFSSLGANQDETYYDANYTTFLLLHQPGDLAPLQKKIDVFMKSEMQGKGATINFTLEPFNRIHLYSEYTGFEPGTPISSIYILGGVAILILLIAGMTYINLSTARSIERAKEVGVRKVIGAGKGQLFGQFVGESVVFCLLAAVLSMGVAALALHGFGRLAGRVLPYSELFSPAFVVFAVLTAILVGVLAGSYPALMLSGFQPIKVLKGAFKNTSGGQQLRQSLIVFQFVISVFLIVSTIVMQRQLNYIQHKQLGYDREHVVVLPTSTTMFKNMGYVKSEFERNPDVLSLSSCANSPVNILGGYNMRSAQMPANEQLAVTADPIDEDFVKTTGLQLIAGSDLSRQDIRDLYPDSSVNGQPVFHFILNESAARELGWSPQEAIGKRMFLDDSRPGFVKGVVKDFHFESLHQPIRPVVLFPTTGGRITLVRVSGHNLGATLAYLEKTYKKVEPYVPFEYHFLDEDFNRLYAAEQKVGTVMNIFSAVAILLACLGLLGLSAFMAKQRVKEIGIRKVLGASIPHLAMLLSVGFIRLAGLAILIASPFAWWAMSKWLQGFQYRISVDWTIFVTAAAAVLLVTLLTVSVQAIRTALLNPVKNLKSE